MSTLAQIRADCLLLLKEVASNTHFNDSELNGFINRSVEITSLFSENAKDRIEWQVEEGVGAYTLPSDNLLISSAYFGNKSITNDLKPLDVYTEESLKAINPYWLDETDATKGTPRRLLWLDRMTVFLDPRPNADNAGKTLEVSYIFQPTPMSDDGQSPNLSLAYHSLLKFYALYLACMALQNDKMSAIYFNTWKSHLDLVKSTLERGASELFRFKWTFSED